MTDADFYSLEQLLDDDGLRRVMAVRDFMEKSVAPVINHYWIREEFPADLVPGLAGLRIAGLACEGYGCPGGSSLLDGMIALELARVDCSIATFMGVHSGLSMGSIYLCGSEEQKQRWLPTHGSHGKDRFLRADRAGGRVWDRGRPNHHRAARRGRLGAQRPEEVDRQRHLR